MYDKITDRVKKLIALALGTHSQEEARTAAKMAVDLIAQHGLLDRPQVRAPPPPPPPAWKVCRTKLNGRVFWLGRRVRHRACHIAKGYK